MLRQKSGTKTARLRPHSATRLPAGQCPCETLRRSGAWARTRTPSPGEKAAGLTETRNPSAKATAGWPLGCRAQRRRQKLGQSPGYQVAGLWMVSLGIRRVLPLKNRIGERVFDFIILGQNVRSIEAHHVQNILRIGRSH